MNRCRYRSLAQPNEILMAVCVVAVLLAGDATRTVAQPSRTDSPTLQELRVSVDELGPWLKRGWQPISLEQYRKLREAARPRKEQSPATWIAHATYSATVVGDELRAGTLVAQVELAGDGPALLSLDPLNLAVSSLKWGSKEAVWGSTPQGRAALFVDHRRRQLNGNWKLKGRPLAQSVRFDFFAPAATVTRLRLRIPEGSVLESTVGVVTGPLPAEKPEWSIWQVDLGGRSRCRLKVCQAEPSANSVPRIVSERDVTYAIRREGMDLLAQFNLEVLHSATSSLSFQLPSDVEVYSVTYGGDQPLATSTQLVGSQQRLFVELPKPLLGQSRPIRIRGIAPTVLGKPWTLPRVQLESGILSSSRLHLHLEPLLQLQPIEMIGCRQASIVSDEEDGESLTFHQDSADAQLTVRVGLPEPEMTARVANFLEITNVFWQLNSKIEWTSHVGSTFSTRSALPPDWEVVEVLPASTFGTSGVANWKIEPQCDGTRILRVEFQHSIGPTESGSVVIRLRRQSPAVGQVVPLPIVLPRDVLAIESILATWHAPEFSVRFESMSLWNRVDDVEASELLAKWAHRPIDEELGTAPRIVYSSVSPNSAGALKVDVARRSELGKAEAGPPTQETIDESSIEKRSGAAAVWELSERAASLELKSIISFGQSGADLHQARFRTKADPRPGQFRFHLPTPAALVSVGLNGHSVMPSRHGKVYVLPRLSPNRSNVIKIRYRCTSNGSGQSDLARVPTPVSSHTVVSFDWSFAVPPDLQLAAEPQSVSLSQPIADLPFTERFFGPLGRPATESFFNPFSVESWQDLGFERNQQQPVQRLEGYLDSAPPGWNVWHGTGPEAAEYLVLRTWSLSWSRTLAWLVMLGVLTIGLACKGFSIEVPRRPALLFFGLCLVAAALSPPMFATVAGGCLTGMLIATLVPLNSLLGAATKKPMKSTVPTGSTVIFPRAGIPLLIALLVSYAMQAMAQDHSVQNGDTSTRGTSGPVADEFTILIPADGGSASPVESVFVYASKQAMSHLQRARKLSEDHAEYLISSANYEASVDESQLVTIEARYRVAVLSSAATTRIDLPLQNANFGQADDCRVNGAPHPIMLAPDGDGYFVILKRAKKAATQTNREDDEPSSQNDATGSGENGTMGVTTTVEWFDIALQLRPQANLVADGGRLAIRIPAVAASNFAVTFQEAFARIEVTGEGSGRIARGTGRALQAEFAMTEQLRLSWSRTAEIQSPPARLTAKSVCMVDAHPTSLSLHARVHYRVVEGGVNSLRWKLPAGMIVRELTAGHPDTETVSVKSAAGSTTDVFMEFDEPQADVFSVDLRLLLPVHRVDGRLQIPAIDFAGQSDSSVDISTISSEVGISAPSDFEVIPELADADSVSEVNIDQFLRSMATTSSEGKSGSDGPRPRIAYQISEPTDLPIRLNPLTPKRTVWQHQVGEIGTHSLNWRLTAEIETAEAPAFRHSLRVSPNLKIETVSVTEDKADRLVRVLRLGDRLDLYLSHPTTGSQNIELSGTVAYRQSQECRLPLIDVIGAVAEESSLSLYHDADVVIESNAFDSLTKFEMGSETGLADATRVYFGQFHLPPDGQQLTISVEPRDDKVDSVTFIDGQEDGRWLVTTGLRFRELAQPRTQFRVRIPRESADEYHLRASGGENSGEPQADGSVYVTLNLNEPAENEFFVTIETYVYRGRISGPLPLPTALNAIPDEHYLLIAPPGAIRPAPPSASELDEKELPDWLPRIIPWDRSSKRWVAYRGHSSHWTFSEADPDDVPSNGENERVIPLMQTRCWFERGQQCVGCTEIWLPAVSPMAELKLSWPSKTELRSLYVDDAPAAHSLSSNVLSVRFDARAGPGVVVVHWSRRDVESLSWFRVFADELPHPVDIDVGHSLLTVVPPSGLRVLRGDGFSQIDHRDQLLDRFEGLLNSARSRLGLDGAEDSVWRALAEVRDSAKHSFSIPSQLPEAEAHTQEQRERYIRIERAYVNLQRSAGAITRESPPADAQDAFVESCWANVAGAANRSIRVGRPRKTSNAISFSLWGIDEGLGAWLLAMVGILVVVLTVRRLGDLDAARELLTYPPLAWALLGVVWWLFLVPSIFGIVLVLIAVFLVFRRRSPMAPADRIIELSD